MIPGYAGMSTCSTLRTCTRNVIHLSGSLKQMGYTMCNNVSSGQSTSCSFSLCPGRCEANYVQLSFSKSSCPSVVRFQKSPGGCFGNESSKRHNLKSLTIKGFVSRKGPLNRHISLAYENIIMRLSTSKQGIVSKFKDSMGSVSLSHRYASGGLFIGVGVCCSNSDPVYAEAAKEKNEKEYDCDMPYFKFSQGKKIYTDYSITGIPGDGRCLFRSVTHGACLRAGKPAPSEDLQRVLADDLRARVADEFIKRRQETEWFVEGDFDTYVAQMRKSHVWGGEPELFIASHVLKMPITVYMYDENAGGLISIAEYGQEYGKENPIRVLYHGFGHYDALQIPGRKGGKSRL